MRRACWTVIAVLAGVAIFGCSRAAREAPKTKSPPSDRAIAYDAPAARPAEVAAEMATPVPSAAPPRAEARPISAPEGRPPAPSAKSPPPAAGAAGEAPSAPASPAEPARYRREAEEGPPVPVRRDIQSGTLTAGSFDDHERFSDYQKFLSDSMQNDTAETFPRLAIGQRVVIRVTGGQGKPVADARVVVRAADPQRRGPQDDTSSPLLDVTTGSDGRTIFLTGIDGARGQQQFQVTVTPPDKTPAFSQVISADQATWEIRLPSAKENAVRRLDLALVVDTTGSMSDELEYLKVEIDSIAQSVRRMFPEVDQRYALVVYRDQGDEYVVRSFDFTASLSEFRQTLARQHASGGGDYPEAVHLAMEQAVKLSWRDEGTARVLFWVADAPPHREFAPRTLEQFSALRKKTVRTFPVAGSGTAHEAEFVMRAGAFLTQGQYLFLTDHSGVGNPHEAPHVPDYVVERLDRLMIRMIASELAGRKLAAQEIIAIEGGRSPYDKPSPVPPGQQGNSQFVPPPIDGSPQPLSWFASLWPGRWSTPHWSILLAIIAGKLIYDVVQDRRRS